jgi:hypothetical protein
MDIDQGRFEATSQKHFLVAQAEMGELNFDAPASIDVKTPDASNTMKPQAAGGAVLIGCVAILVAWGLTLNLFKKTRAIPGQTAGEWVKSVHWNVLSMVVLSFLGLNVLFGLLTAFLVTDGGSATDEYFENMTAFKLAKLSHQHFFGYGLLFGILALLALCFVGARKRTIFPIIFGFIFTILDVSSWWMAKYISTGFHLLSLISGSLFSLAFVWLFVLTVKENFTAIRARR